MVANRVVVFTKIQANLVDAEGQQSSLPLRKDVLRLRTTASVLHNLSMRDTSSRLPVKMVGDHRLCKHADYQRVYREGRKQFSSSMSYFFALRADLSPVPAGPRVGLTAGKVVGKAVERNRIKRRMRDIVRRMPLSADMF